MKNILVFAMLIFIHSCTKEVPTSTVGDASATINSKKYYGNTSIGIYPDWFEVYIRFNQNEFDDGYSINIRKNMDSLKLNYKYILGENNEFNSFYDSIPSRYNNACFSLTHGNDARSGCHQVCTNCDTKSYFMVTEIAIDSSFIAGTMDLSVVHQLKVENQTNPNKADYRIKDVYFKIKPQYFR